jgi:hypothetical protein
MTLAIRNYRRTMFFVFAVVAAVIGLIFINSSRVEPRLERDLGTHWRCSTTLGIFTECTKLAKSRPTNTHLPSV